MFVSLFPCAECAKVIIQSGIREVVFTDDKYHDSESSVASRRMFDLAGVVCRRVKPSRGSITLNQASSGSSAEGK